MSKRQSKGVVSIHGKQYKTVALRVSEFRNLCPAASGWGLVTEILSIDSDGVTVIARISDPEGRIVATGHAEENRKGQINKTSALENAETSAIGRALASFGLAGDEFCSADELITALKNKNGTGVSRQPSSGSSHHHPANRETATSRDKRDGKSSDTKAPVAPFKPVPGSPPPYKLTKRYKSFEAGTSMWAIPRGEKKGQEGTGCLWQIKDLAKDNPEKLREVEECIEWRRKRAGCMEWLFEAIDHFLKGLDKEEEANMISQIIPAVERIADWEMKDIPEKASNLAEVIGKLREGYEWDEKRIELFQTVIDELTMGATVEGGAK